MSQLPQSAPIANLRSDEFHPCAFPQRLRSDEIHLWFFPNWSGSLRQVAESPELRRLLAAYQQSPLHEVHIERGAHGKPYLRNTTLCFNLSHSDRTVLLALTRSRQVGVDVESLRRPRPIEALARRWFDPREAATLGRLPEALRQQAFVRLWCCKEAVLKAHGRGIGFGVHRIAFQLDRRAMPNRLYPDASGPGTQTWHVVTLTPDSHHVAALAWRGLPRRVRAFFAQTG